jgi:acetate kinase
MTILAINCGSSSIKFGLISFGENEDLLVRGLVERIGLGDSRLTFTLSSGERMVLDNMMHLNHERAIDLVLESLTDPKTGVISSVDEIYAVGHRVVHGGEGIRGPVLIDDQVMQLLSDRSDLAPLHNPPNIAGIKAVSSALPKVLQVAVFDTAFHQTMPKHAYIYPLPYELYEKYGIRRYGFHGTSYRYVAEEAARFLGRALEDLRIIICHLGGGASIAAVKFGASVDTSMGFTPLEGLEMGTRCGDLDPSVVLYLMEKAGMSAIEVGDLLNNRSGLLGVSGYSSDMREIEEAVFCDVGRRDLKIGYLKKRNLNTGHPHHSRSKLALEIYVYRIKKYIGAYAAAMGGLDAVIFTGGVGENSEVVPEEACSEMELFGIRLGPRVDLGSGWYELSGSGSQVRVLVIPTDEEMMIARETYRLLRGWHKA